MLIKDIITTAMFVVLMMVSTGSTPAQKPKPTTTAKDVSSGMATGKKQVVVPIDITFDNANDFGDFLTKKFTISVTPINDAPVTGARDKWPHVMIQIPDDDGLDLRTVQKRDVRVYIYHDCFPMKMAPGASCPAIIAESSPSGINLKVFSSSLSKEYSAATGAAGKGQFVILQDFTRDAVRKRDVTVSGREGKIMILAYPSRIVEPGSPFTLPKDAASRGKLVYTVACDSNGVCTCSTGYISQ